MIDYTTYCQIQHLYHSQGLKVAQISCKLAIDPRTVQRWINEEKYKPRASKRRKKSKLDPFKDHILSLLEKHPSYTARQIYQFMQEHGFCGSYTTVKNFVTRVRPHKPQAYLTLSFEPGECAQVDWGSYGTVQVGTTRRRLSFFVMVLSYSRMLYVEFAVSEKLENFLGCHISAFEYFGGVPQKVMIDNLKTGVLKHPRGEPALYHPHYAEFAAHYGFEPVACNVRKPNEKGRVENAVGYVKTNLLNGLDISDFKILGPAARVWMQTVANCRIHGYTQKQPVELFALEKPKLGSLPVQRYDNAIIVPTRSNRCFRIVVDTNRYSVPAEYASSRLTLRRYPERLRIYHGQRLIAEHVRRYDRNQDYEHPDHAQSLLNQRHQAKNHKQLKAFLQLGKSAAIFYENMQNRSLNLGHHVRNILGLVGTYGRDNVVGAIDHANELQAYNSQYVLNLLEQQSRLMPPAGKIQLTHHQELLEIPTPRANLDLYRLTQDPS